MANPPQVFVGGDGAARKIISPDKLKQTSRFSLTSIIESLPKLCKDKDEFRQVDMDDTFSVSSQFSTENGLNSLAPLPVEEEDVLVDKDGECIIYVCIAMFMAIDKELQTSPSHHTTSCRSVQKSSSKTSQRADREEERESAFTYWDNAITDN